jgi:enoyl-[acyl-carrier-protein] reductase (NADH)
VTKNYNVDFVTTARCAYEAAMTISVYGCAGMAEAMREAKAVLATMVCNSDSHWSMIAASEIADCDGLPPEADCSGIEESVQ